MRTGQGTGVSDSGTSTQESWCARCFGCWGVTAWEQGAQRTPNEPPALPEPGAAEDAGVGAEVGYEISLFPWRWP